MRSDRDAEYISLSNLLGTASLTNELLLTLVARGSGERLSLDRDGDGYPDRTEIDFGLSPDDPSSRGSNDPPHFTALDSIFSYPPLRIHSEILFKTQFASYAAPAYADEGPGLTNPSYGLLGDVPTGVSINATSGELLWMPTNDQADKTFRFSIFVSDNGAPALSTAIPMVFNVIGPVRVTTVVQQSFAHRAYVLWPTATGARYRVEYKDDLNAAQWNELPEVSLGVDYTWPFPPQRFYRVVLQSDNAAD
jgi:hypothetical protein